MHKYYINVRNCLFSLWVSAETELRHNREYLVSRLEYYPFAATASRHQRRSRLTADIFQELVKIYYYMWRRLL